MYHNKGCDPRSAASPLPRVSFEIVAVRNCDWLEIEMTRFNWLVMLCPATGGRTREHESPFVWGGYVSFVF